MNCKAQYNHWVTQLVCYFFLLPHEPLFYSALHLLKTEKLPKTEVTQQRNKYSERNLRENKNREMKTKVREQVISSTAV